VVARIAERLEGLPSLADLPDDMLLTIEETAAYLGVGPSTLDSWRLGLRGSKVGGGPPHVPLHKGPRSPVKYLVADIRAYIQQQRIDKTEGTETPADSS
jgi:transposase-like protein